ncbi:MAG TPA: long-chain fatty acid--CoA ligase [Longimicrobiales bacterium]|nr:long-chain fatty acid--CoA ligase [Longimicrobiales bacterium]
MSSTSYATDDRRVPESTLVELFFDAVDRFGDHTALQRMPTPESLEDISYREVLDVVKQVAAALQARGLARGDRVAILSENRPEWALTDFGCLCAGVLDVPIYTTLTAPQVGYMLHDSGAKIVFASTPEQAEKALAAAEGRGLTIDVVAFDPSSELPARVVPWSDFLASGSERGASWSDEEFRRAALQAKPDDVATVLYTSGTTGEPKGVMLTHNNVASNVRASRIVFDIGNADNTVSFLPLSHILQRMVDYLFFWVGCTIGYVRSMDTLVADMKVIRPTVVVSVPRVYEKIYNNVMQARGLKKRLVDWAVGVADRVADLRLAGREPKGLLALQYRIADKLVFSKVKQAVGGRLRFFVSGGGPLAPELNRFFYSIGMTILEGYGLTETSPVTNVNTLAHFRIGTVGKPVPATEIKIAEDGEILVRGPQVMKGYYNKPDATAEAIDAEGWFATGDIGELDAEGFLRITDRKKDIIVTAGGKNVAPQPIENRLKTHPLVEQVVMIGDRRKYVALLVVPHFAKVEEWARANGVSWGSREELVSDARVVQFVEREVLGSLEDLASFERPKKIALLPHDLTVENGFLTPSLKVKRRVVHEELDAVIDRLYEEEAVDAAR